MKIKAQRRLAGLAGLLVLTVLASAVFVSAALAINATGSGTGGVSYTWARNVASTAGSAGTFVAGTQGRGGVAGQVAAVSVPAAAPAAATAPSSGTSTTTWIVVGVAVAALAVALVAWALARRRSRLASDTRQYCSLHPDDALCGAV